MKRGVRKTTPRRVALIGCALGLGVLVLGLSSCALFNIFPIAGFTIGPSTAGPVPFTVTVSAAPSTDEDGEITDYDWDFGDGTQGTGKSASHTYTTQGTFTIILTVTDNWGAQDDAAKTVYVTSAEPEGPRASFTANPTSGTSPLAVTFDASGSTYEGGTIASYDWTFGDGGTWSGKTAQHTFFSAGNQTFTVTLTVRGSDNKTATATRSITVTVPGGGGTTPTGNEPSARFTIDESIGVAPFLVHFDPSDSEAGDGRTILLYTWSFGDNDATSDPNPSVQEHVYATDAPSKTFTVTLLVLDNEGDSDSISKTVKIYNHRPVVGFDIANPPGGDKDDGGAVEYTAAEAWAANRWVADDVVYGDILDNNPVDGGNDFPVTITVAIRSRALQLSWYQLNDTDDQTTLEQANGTLATSGTVPGAPDDADGDDYEDHNFSYDPEGQAWDGDVPDWFTDPTDYGQAWGIRYLRIDWGDGSGEQQVDYAAAGAAYDDNAIVTHNYTVNETTVRTITVTAVDWLGQESAEFSRRVTLKEGYEVNEDEI